MKYKIANILPHTVWGDVTPESFEKGIGGREGSMLHLSRELAKKGNEVTNFVGIEQGKRYQETEHGYHEYIPVDLTWPMLGNFDWDVAICWECPSVFRYEKIRERIKLRICEMQVAHVTIPERPFIKECHYIAALSEWHKGFLGTQEIEPEKGIVVLPNGIQIDKYPLEKISIDRLKKPFTFVYSSSPDRGLWHLLRGWHRVREIDPNAKLFVCYGALNWIEESKWIHGLAAEMATEIERLLDQPGVIDVGKVGAKTLNKLQLEATAWLYPFDGIQPTETGCITAIENAAAGNPMIITNGDCLEDEFGDYSCVVDLPIFGDDVDKYFDVVDEVLTDPNLYGQMKEAGRVFAETRDWGLIADKWIDLFDNELS